MFEWIFGNSRSENARQLYVMLCSLELETFKEKLLHIDRTQSPEKILWDFTDPYKRTLLHIGVMTGNVDIVRHLCYVPIDAQDDRGFTALHYAVMVPKNYAVVQWLIKREIDVNMQSNQGHTAYDIVEGFLQEECERLSQSKEIDKEFFNKIFLKKIDIMFDENISKEKIYDFLINHPTITEFVLDHPALTELITKKQMMELLKCPRKNSIDVRTFLKPRFVYFEQPERSGVYWYQVPKAPAEVQTRRNKATMCHESMLASSKLHKKAETVSITDTTSEQMSNIITNSSIVLQQTLNLKEIDLTEENLNALGAFSPSERQASVIKRFLSDVAITTNSDDGHSEYTLVSTSAKTPG